MSEEKKCSTPRCRRKPVMQMLGDHPLCRKCGDEKNLKARLRSAERRAAGHYSPSIIARWSPAKQTKMANSKPHSQTEGGEK